MDQKTRDKVLAGLERIAFGDTRDPVRLLFLEDLPPAELKRMDLSSVAEIKRAKGGAMEIKFLDRIRALECMMALGGDEPAAGLYQALERGAQALEGMEEGPPCG